VSRQNVSLALQPGTLIAGYEIVRPLGQGGFGITYEAYNRVVKRRVAIKEFFPLGIASREGATQVIFPADKGGIVGWALKRFEESTSSLADLQHRNIIDVMNYVSDHGTGYMVMEHVDGDTLSDWLKARAAKPTLEEVKPVLDPVFDALEYMHRHNLLHRDVAPDNIMLRRSGEPVLIDFGAIKVIEEETRAQTGTSYAVSKRHYSSPEQTSGNTKLDARTDVYSAAAVLYRALTGVPPEDASDRRADVFDGLPDPYRPVRNGAAGNVPDAVASIIDRALSLRRDERPSGLGALRNGIGWTTSAEDSRRTILLDDDVVKKPERRPLGKPLAAAALAAAVVAGVLYVALGGSGWKPGIRLAEEPKPKQKSEPVTPARTPRLLAGDNATFFDPATGNAIVWFARSADGEYEFFDADGYHPRTGTKLQLVDRQVVREWQVKEEERKKPKTREPTLADGHVWCRSRFGEHAIAVTVERGGSTPFSCTCRDGYTWNPTTTFCVAMQARIPTLLERVEVGRWAVGGTQFCGTPSRTYTLAATSSDFITWRDGNGRQYVEQVIYAAQYEFRTRTVNSPSDPPGTNWSYVSLDQNSFQVTKGSSGTSSTAVRCP
jgi:serine/threonine protein kinase